MWKFPPLLQNPGADCLHPDDADVYLARFGGEGVKVTTCWKIIRNLWLRIKSGVLKGSEVAADPYVSPGGSGPRLHLVIRCFTPAGFHTRVV